MRADAAKQRPAGALLLRPRPSPRPCRGFCCEFCGESRYSHSPLYRRQDCHFCTQVEHNERFVRVGPDDWSSVDYGNGSVLRFTAWHGDWQQDADPITNAWGGGQWPPAGAPRAVVLLAGLGAWPLANDSLPYFKSRVAHVLAQLPRHPGWVYVVRTAPYVCCNSRDNDRRYTSRRALLFRAALVRAFLRAFPGGLVWDTTAVSEALPMDDIGRRCDRCGSAHLGGELVEADTAVLRHLLCGITIP